MIVFNGRLCKAIANTHITNTKPTNRMAQLTLLKGPADKFPPVYKALAEPNGLLAIGGQMDTARLMSAYAQGIFPWYSKGEPIMWWSPDPRCIIETEKFHVSRSFSRFIKKQPFVVTINNAFSQVIYQCAQPRSYEKETWINDDIIHAYTQLHQDGLAHSIEVWQHDQLVGGVYGIFIANTFCGESMFSLRPNASKTALYALSCWLKAHRVHYIDCQIPNPHLMSLGAREMRRHDFINHLNEDTLNSAPFAIDWSPKVIPYE